MKKRLLKITCLFLSILIIVANFIPAALASNSAIDEARHSVVRVVAPGGGWGTAFIIAHSGMGTILVTNEHVVSGGGPYYILPSDRTGVWIEAQVTYLQIGLDLAILTTAAGLSARPVLPLASIDTVRAADTVYALGFPGTADQIIDYGAWYPSSPDDVTVTSGIVSSVSAIKDNTNSIQHDTYISHGNSGGPLLNSDGAVIGINTWINPQFEAARSINYAVHVTYLTDALNDLGITYTTPSAAIVTSPEEPGEDVAPPVPESQPGFDIGRLFSEYWWILAIVAGLGIGMMLRKKQPAPAAPAAAQPQAQVPVAASPVYPSAPSASSQLIGSRGQFAGQTFPINGVLYIGRDPQRCQVVFPSDTRGISSMHCEIRQQGPGVTLTDKGSTYGTFLTGGRKLNANETVSLRSGESFYLADVNNEFKVL